MKMPTTIGTRWTSSSNTSAGSSSKYGRPILRTRSSRDRRGATLPGSPAPPGTLAERASSLARTNVSARHLLLGAGELLLHCLSTHWPVHRVGEQVLDCGADERLELRFAGHLRHG